MPKGPNPYIKSSNVSEERRSSWSVRGLVFSLESPSENSWYSTAKAKHRTQAGTLQVNCSIHEKSKPRSIPSLLHQHKLHNGNKPRTLPSLSSKICLRSFDQTRLEMGSNKHSTSDRARETKRDLCNKTKRHSHTQRSSLPKGTDLKTTSGTTSTAPCQR